MRNNRSTKKPRVKFAIARDRTDLQQPNRVPFELTEKLWDIAKLEARQLKSEGREDIKASEGDLICSCVGELSIQDILYELEVPSVRNPVFLHDIFAKEIRPWSERHDFEISGLGSVDVKTTPPDSKAETGSVSRVLMLINQNVWRSLPSDYAFSIKIESRKTAWLYGSIRGSAVESRKPWCRRHRFEVKACSKETCRGPSCWAVRLGDFTNESSDELLPGTFLIKKLAALSQNPNLRSLKQLGAKHDL